MVRWFSRLGEIVSMVTIERKKAGLTGEDLDVLKPIQRSIRDV